MAGWNEQCPDELNPTHHPGSLTGLPMVLAVSTYNQKAELCTIFEIRLKNVVRLVQKVTWLERWHVTGPDDHFYYIPQLKGKDEYDNDDARRQKRGRDNPTVYYSWVPRQRLNSIYICSR